MVVERLFDKLPHKLLSPLGGLSKLKLFALPISYIFVKSLVLFLWPLDSHEYPTPTVWIYWCHHVPWVHFPTHPLKELMDVQSVLQVCCLHWRCFLLWHKNSFFQFKCHPETLSVFGIHISPKLGLGILLWSLTSASFYANFTDLKTTWIYLMFYFS